MCSGEGRRGRSGTPGPDGGWSGGNPHDYDREFCIDQVQLATFLRATQPEAAEALALDEDGPTRRKFLSRLQGEISKRGTIDVLRHAIRHGAHDLDLFYGAPSAGNPQAQERFAQTVSPSSGSSATAATTPSGRSTSACSSTACRSSPSS